MFENIADGFLGDVQKLAFLLVGKPCITIVKIQSGGDAGIFGKQPDGITQGIREAVFLKCQTAKPPDGAADLGLAEA